jgi:uncharacterized repeat protein (TIGR01451 family)
VARAKTRLLKLSAVTLGAVLAATAAAEVTLETSVEKWESYETASGSVQRRLTDAELVVPGDELRYTITFVNQGPEPVDAGSIVITNPLPEGTEYLPGTATGPDTLISFSADGEKFAPDAAAAAEVRAIRWSFQPALAPGDSSSVAFEVRLQ